MASSSVPIAGNFSGNGPRSLKQMALRIVAIALADGEPLPLDSSDITTEMIGSIVGEWWKVAQIKPSQGSRLFEVWKSLSHGLWASLLRGTDSKGEKIPAWLLNFNWTIESSEDDPDRSLDKYIAELEIPPPMATPSNWTPHFLVSLRIDDVSSFPPNQLLSLAKLKYLAHLDIFHGQTSDRLLKGWSETPNPFPALQTLKITNHASNREYVTVRSVPYLSVFPKLLIYELVGTVLGEHNGDIEDIARDSGWRGVVDGRIPRDTNPVANEILLYPALLLGTPVIRRLDARKRWLAIVDCGLLANCWKGPLPPSLATGIRSHRPESGSHRFDDIDLARAVVSPRIGWVSVSLPRCSANSRALCPAPNPEEVWDTFEASIENPAMRNFPVDILTSGVIDHVRHECRKLKMEEIDGKPILLPSKPYVTVVIVTHDGDSTQTLPPRFTPPEPYSLVFYRYATDTVLPLQPKRQQGEPEPRKRSGRKRKKVADVLSSFGM